jgi:YidC/Oxa1 family membrane protein insertase
MVRPRHSRGAPGTRIQHHYRSISLFGWGSSSKPSPEQTTSPISSQDLHISEPGSRASAIEPTRSVRASHATSDSPDPSILQSAPPGTHEPEVLRSIEDSIAGPHGQAVDSDIASIPERVGYLKEVCGIDFGYGTTSIFQAIVENIHVYSGLSWGLSFIALTLVARTIMLRPVIRAQEMTLKMKEIQPILTPLREEYKAAIQSGDKIRMQTTSHQIRNVSRESGVSMIAVFKPLLYQLPLNFAGYRVGHAMGAIPVPALETESFLWMSNLAMSDPYILPAVVGSLVYLTIHLSIAQAPIPATGTTASLQKAMKYGAPPISFVWLMWQPGILQVFFATQTTFSFLQQRLINNPTTRAWIGLPPNNPQPSSSNPGTPQPQIQPTQIAGMTMRAPSSAQPTPSTPTQDVSAIDKFVDTVKKQRDSVAKTWNTTKKTAADYTEKRGKKAEARKADVYEYERRQEAERERNWRNENIREARKQ